jgi:hypothetical protein
MSNRERSAERDLGSIHGLVSVQFGAATEEQASILYNQAANKVAPKPAGTAAGRY